MGDKGVFNTKTNEPLYNKYTLKDKLKAMGPGILVVGTFMGPGSITSATRAGADFGYSLLWTVMFSVIAVIVLQEMASRLGIVTQEGLAENTMIFFKDRPVAKNILRIVIAFSITLGGMSYMSGDLTGTAIGVSTITGISPNIIAAVWGCCILIIINISDDILNTLTKLLSITVTVMAVVFIATMLIVRPNAGEILKGFVPGIPKGAALTCGAMIGTTVVPYNMFIHSTSSRKNWSDPKQLPLSKFDTIFTMILGGVITAAIMISAGTVIRGLEVNSVADMSGALEPLLGRFAKPFLCIGMIAAGISASTGTPLGVSFVLSGLYGWKMDKTDKRFFFTNVIVLVTGIIVALSGFEPVKIIMTTQAVNAVFLPLIVFLLLYLTSRKSLMGRYENSRFQNLIGVIVGIGTIIISISSIISLI